MKTRLLLLSMLLLGLAGKSQLYGQFPQAMQQAPDCQIYFSFTAVGNGSQLANYGPGTTQGPNLCTTWTLGYAVSNVGGTVTSLSLLFQSAPANTPTTPGTWGNYTGAAVTGAVNSTSTVGSQSTFSNNLLAIPWVRMRLDALSATGTTTVFGILQGWNSGHSGSGSGGGGGSGCVGTSATPCVVDGVTAAGSAPTTPPVLVAGQTGNSASPGNIETIHTDANGNQIVVGAAAAGAALAGNPVLVAGSDGTDARDLLMDTTGRTEVVGGAAVGSAPGNPVATGFRDDSGNALADYGFPDQAAVTISASTDTVIVAGVIGTLVYVGHLSFSLDSAQTVTIRQGTGSMCGSNTLILYGPAPNVAAIALDYDSKSALHTTISVTARDLCLHLGGSATVGGGVIYGQH